jgi:hypothetical protein
MVLAPEHGRVQLNSQVRYSPGLASVIWPAIRIQRGHIQHSALPEVNTQVHRIAIGVERMASGRRAQSTQMQLGIYFLFFDSSFSAAALAPRMIARHSSA